VGQSITYTAWGTVDPSVVGTISNTASTTVLLDTGDPDVTASDPIQGNNTAADSDVLTPIADLSIAKIDDPDPVVTGFDLDYTITVTNAGPSWAHDTVVTDILPVGVTLTSTTGCAEDQSGVPTCSLGAVEDPVYGTPQKQYEITVNIDEGTLGEITNTAIVSTSSSDPTLGNNTATADTMVIPKADLVVDKVDSDDPAVAGTQLVYTVTVNNLGPYDAADVAVTDTLPAGVTFVSTSGCAEDPTGVPDCTLGLIAALGSAQYTITVDIDADTLGTLTNEVEIEIDPDELYEINPLDNRDEEDTLVTAEADLVATKDNGLASLQLGQEVTYTIVISNDGPSDAPEANIDDDVPVELLDPEWTCVPAGDATCAPGTVPGNIVDVVTLPVGDSVEYTLIATVDPLLDLSSPVTIDQTVSVTKVGDYTDPDGNNNEATDSDPVASSAIFVDGFESGDTSAWAPPKGGQ
ncbi:MAG: DUF11 domain-containing protein, partial [Deltaproteobacteria bacterium]|nr:DUF11 domain-containing protein [Deltaproteobacteria bacterium]